MFPLLVLTLVWSLWSLLGDQTPSCVNVLALPFDRRLIQTGCFRF